MKQFFASILVVLLAVPAAFAQVDNHAKTKKGAVIGGAAGAVLGGVLGNNRGSGNAKRGAVIGGVVGAAAGGIIGAMMDKQERELRQIEGVNVQRTSTDELKVTVKKSDGSANASKLVEYSVDQPKINHSAPGGLSTSATGEVTIKLRREGAAWDANTPMPVQVIVWLGLVSKTITVNM